MVDLDHQAGKWHHTGLISLKVESAKPYSTLPFWSVIMAQCNSGLGSAWLPVVGPVAIDPRELSLSTTTIIITILHVYAPTN